MTPAGGMAPAPPGSAIAYIAITVERLCAAVMSESVTRGGDAACSQITLGNLVSVAVGCLDLGLVSMLMTFIGEGWRTWVICSITPLMSVQQSFLSFLTYSVPTFVIVTIHCFCSLAEFLSKIVLNLDMTILSRLLAAVKVHYVYSRQCSV